MIALKTGHISEAIAMNVALENMQDTIGQRIKFLLDHLGLSARKFSREIGVAENNTQNYLPPSSREPGAKYLELITLRFESINPAWLLTGQGEPFLSTSDESTQNIHVQKNFRSPIVGANHGTAHQEQHVNSATDDKAMQALALAQKEIDGLKAELARADALLAAKDETIGLLKAAFKNPN